jgi:hypothetical protein
VLAPERSYVPTIRKRGTVAYETLIANAPAIISSITPRHDERVRGSSASAGADSAERPKLAVALLYDRPGDHIGWHYDHNFYRGRHFTVRFALDNRGSADGGLSHAQLKARTGEGELAVATAPNTMVVFEGAAVRHKVTPIENGERRLMLSMTYCTDPGASWRQGASRRIKDIAFFGMRALWT